MSIGWPEGIWLSLVFMGFGYNLAEALSHENTWRLFLSKSLGYILMFGLLWWGGFFA